MLLVDGPHRDDLAVAVGPRASKDRFAQKNALAVMPEGAMAHIGDVRLALVEPVVDGQIVLRHAAEQPCGTNGMMIGMSHYLPSTAGSIRLPSAVSARSNQAKP